MIIRHTVNGLEIEEDVSKDKDNNKDGNNTSFLLTNKAGSYIWMNSADYCQPTNHYQGAFFFTKEHIMMKVMENLNTLNAGRIKNINNHFNYVERERENMTEAFAMPSHFSAIAYKADKKAMLELVLDIRDSYDSRSFGKYYKIYEEKKCLVIEFTKKTDNREDKTHGEEEYKIFLVIATNDKSANYEQVQKWFERYYSLNDKRNEQPRRWVFHALNIEADNAVFAFSGNKKHAINEARHLIRYFNNVFRKKDILTRLNLNKIEDDETRMAYIAALNSIKSLCVPHHHVFAGLPWFSQFWTRDTAISLKAFMLEHLEGYAKHVLLDYLNNIGGDGRIENRVPPTDFEGADSTGWVFRRLYDLSKMHKLSKKEKLIIKDRLQHAINLLLKYRTKNGLDINKKQETWMDSPFEGDERAGARIEIQALRLSMYNLMSDFSDDSRYVMQEQKLKKLIVKNFWNKRYLNDGIDKRVADKTIRPNVFLAAYIFHSMLSNKEWIKCFDSVLPNLSLWWGGLSSIDKKSPLFHKHHTGSDDISYHHGDSWYFLNNMAAIVLHKTDKEKYKRYINKIVRASTKEILWQGAIGHHSEISSASSRQSLGCQAQLWSAAMFIELIHELYG